MLHLVTVDLGKLALRLARADTLGVMFQVPITLRSRIAAVGVMIGYALSGPVFAQDATEGGEPTPPDRIVTLGLCADQLALSLSLPHQIVARSQPVEAFPPSLREQAQTKPQHDNNLRQILELAPKLIIAGPDADPQLVERLRALEFEIYEIPEIGGLAEGRAAYADMARVLGREKVGAAILRRADLRLAIVAYRRNERRLRTVLLADPPHVQSGGIKSDLIALAGLTDVTRDEGVLAAGEVNIERLMASDPDYILVDGNLPRARSKSGRLAHHPALDRFLMDKPVVYVPPSLWSCPGPWLIDGLRYLIVQTGGQVNDDPAVERE